MEQTAENSFFKSKVLGHPSGLFVLFFTEMWERFSFYGMRVLLINFLTMALIGTNPGWAWTQESAGALFGTYAGLLYLTPILGGMIADRYIGYRWAVVVGAFIMTLGHISMAMETEASLYVGLGLLVIGTGFFKPNITSILSEMYKDVPEKKDGAYTIFYMGVNAGAFFGMMMCGYLAERIGWSWGFGLAGIFMLLGTLQFWLAKPLFGHVGEVPKKDDSLQGNNVDSEEEIRNPFTLIDKILIGVVTLFGLLYIFLDPLFKISERGFLKEISDRTIVLFNKQFQLGNFLLAFFSIAALILLLIVIISRLSRYTKVVRERFIAVIIFAFFTIIFFIPFEQGATSLVLFARDFTNRVLSGNEAIIYNIVNALLTIIPLLILSYVLILLYKQTHKRILSSNLVLALCFAGLWGISIWILYNDYSKNAYKISYQAVKIIKLDKNRETVLDDKKNIVYDYIPVSESTILKPTDIVETKEISVITPNNYKENDKIVLHAELGNFVELNPKQEERIRQDYITNGKKSEIVKAVVKSPEKNQVEITTSWFSILNSFFIIALASLFTKWWDSRFNPSAAVKYGLGLIVMSLGFAVLAYGSRIIPQGADEGFIRVSMIWLILAYLFHTLGELCLSPVGLSYVSKLVPGRMIAFMFGMWYLAIAIGNKLAGTLGGMSKKIAEEHSISYFFLLLTIFPMVAGILVILLNPIIKKLMHGVK